MADEIFQNPRDKADTVSIEIPLAAVRALRPAARARDISVPRLISDLIETVANDGLVTAVLDDCQ
jgi:hypothetical protein